MFQLLYVIVYIICVQEFNLKADVTSVGDNNLPNVKRNINDVTPETQLRNSVCIETCYFFC